jgi:cytochrome b6-f complex iron-sulfur subunit
MHEERGQPGQYVLVSDYPSKPTRRSFLMSWAGVAWGTFAVTSGLGTLATLRFMLPNVLFEPPQVFKAGTTADYEWDVPDGRYKESQRTWIVKLHKDWNGKPQLTALDTTCTHLGCTPNVLGMERKIKCPCHGSGFRFTGINFEGPAPRPLERYAVSIDPVDGRIVVDKTRKFQFEKGRWEDPASFIDLSVEKA